MPFMPPVLPTPTPAATGAPGIDGGSTMVVQAVGPVSRGARLAPVAAGLTDPGKRRGGEPNQDNILAITGTHDVNGRSQPFGLFVVADGMGGHTDGKEASRRTVEIVANHVMPILQAGAPLDFSRAAALLRESAIKANADLREQNLSHRADMGTTLTAALILGDVVCVANVGDSRTYRLHPDAGLTQITTDHSVVASLVAAGVIRPEEAYTHPRRNQIYRSLGGQHEDADVDLFQVALEPGDRLLLCSDGLWEMVRDAQIEATLRGSPDPRQAAERLIQAANENGGEDNISVIVVRMMDEPAQSGEHAGVRVLAAPTGGLFSGGR
jgi:serine/threonine protein phosphatase PrpC